MDRAEVKRLGSERNEEHPDFRGTAVMKAGA